MKGLVDTINRETERVFLVGVQLKAEDSWCIDESLDELTELVTTAGGEVVGRGTATEGRMVGVFEDTTVRDGHGDLTAIG